MQQLNSIISAIVFVLAFTFTSSAQNVTPTNGFVKFDKESRPCLVVHVDPEPKMLKKAWKKYLKENHDLKLSGGKLMSAERVTVNDISTNALDFYTQIIEDVNGSEMSVFGRFGYDIYFDELKTPAEYVKVKTMMEDFLKSYVSSYYKEIIDDTEKKVKKLTKTEYKLEKRITKDANKADKLKVKAKQLEEDVEHNKAEVETLKEKIKQRDEKLKKYKQKLNEVR